MKILVTGTAGFIGFHFAKKLLEPGDIESTYADTSELMKDFNYKPATPLDVGVSEFTKWYRKFYNI